jgi:hypothetical protein
MFYGGESNVPGAVGNVGAYGSALAGTWMRRDFPQGQQPEADQLFRRGLENTESGKKMQENIQRVRQMLPQAMGIPGMVPMGNAGFYAGPQMGQMQQSLPPGYTNKTVS